MSKTKLRDSAKGRECQIRIPGICNGNPETVVLCHLPGGGMGAKRPDIFGAYGCSACHDVVDGRVLPVLSDSYEKDSLNIEIYFHEGVFRTQQIMLDEGLITIE